MSVQPLKQINYIIYVKKCQENNKQIYAVKNKKTKKLFTIVTKCVIMLMKNIDVTQKSSAEEGNTLTEQQKTVLYEEYGGKVMGYIVSKVNNRFIAEDLCSEVFLKVYEKIDTFDSEKASLSTWIYTIARNRLTDYYRTRRVFEEIPETLSSDNSVEDDYLSKESLEALAEALKCLDERERTIIIRRYYSGMTLKEIGEKLGISYAYVKVLHKKALENLKNFFQN